MTQLDSTGRSSGRAYRGAKRLVPLAVVLLLAILLAVTVAASDSPEEITDCIEIDTAGTYELQHNVSSDGTCLEITADDVVFDGQNHTVTGGDDGFGQVAAVNVHGDDNVTVRNVAIDGDSDVGISVSNIDTVSLQNVTADGPGVGSNGISVDNTAEITVRDVDVTGYPGSITLTDVDGFTIESADLAGGIHDGIELLGVSNGTIRDVVGVDKGDSVVAVPDTIHGPTSNVTMDNVTAKWSETGFSLESGAVGNISISNSTAVGNDGSGFELGAAPVTVSDSQAIENDEYGIVLDESSDTTITNVESRENADNDLRVDGTPNVSIENFDIGDSTAANTTLSIAAATDVELGSTTAPDGSPPDLVSIDRYVQAENVSEASALSVSIQYEEADVTDVNESTLSMWNDDGEWSEYEDATVDTDEQSINATIEDFGTVGVFGEEAEDLPVFNVTEVALTEDDVEEGTDVPIDATVENVGTETGEYTAHLEIDGIVESNTTVQIDPGATAVAEFTHTFEDAGEYEVAVDGVSGGTVTVSAPSTPPPSPSPDPDPTPDIAVTSASLDETTITPSDAVAVTAVLENTGDAAGEHELEMTVGDDLVRTELVSVEAGETTELSIAHTFDEIDFELPADFEVWTDDVEAGTVTVSPEDLTPATFLVRDVTPGVDIDEPGAEASISATVENVGDEPDTRTVEGHFDGEVVYEEMVTLEPGESHTIDVDLETAGLDFGSTYEYAISTDDDSDTGVVTVAPADGDESDAVDDGGTDDTTDDEMSGFGIVVGLVAVPLAVVLVRRSR